jgi:hypothetical protein
MSVKTRTGLFYCVDYRQAMYCRKLAETGDLPVKISLLVSA